ncbi:MAG: hypothetical protein K1X55_08915 [Chitinophagales bacterium]|nr:hypothetical protein [Chitinophagales bacterium]
MERKYYICGQRPVIVEIYKTHRDYLAMNWDTTVFEENFRYAHQINFDPSGDVEEVNKEEFEAYVQKLRTKKGFN